MRELTRSREIARFRDFASPDARGEFPTSNFLQELVAVITTQLTDRSYVVTPADPLTAKDNGIVAAIDIASVVIHWPDIAHVSYQSQSVTGLDFSTKYALYFEDVDRAGGTPAVFITKDATQVLETGGRIFLGVITTPADGGGDVTVSDVVAGGGMGRESLPRV